ncbi:hypothetical protein B1748_25180 [Paenibacillus sp. MY03]|nr:hypothetical protein B1748_25180 [Paenibacillus sp. MY03]
MRKIDVNCMIGNWVKQDVEPLLENQVQDELHYYDIDRVIAYHGTARSSNPMYGNERLLDYCRSNQSMIPCMVVSPHYKYVHGWSFLEDLLVKEKIQFIRIFPKEQGYTLGSKLTHEIFGMAEKLGTHMIIDYEEITSSDDREMPEFDRLLSDFPSVQVIVTAFRHRRNMMMYSYLENHSNFYTELSLCDNWKAYEQAIDRYGSDRILWGSNMPFNKPGSAITMLSYADISERDKEKIAYGNLQRLIEGGGEGSDKGCR